MHKDASDADMIDVVDVDFQIVNRDGAILRNHRFHRQDGVSAEQLFAAPQGIGANRLCAVSRPKGDN